MKVVAIVVASFVGVTLIFFIARFVDESIAPLFLNCRITRLGEKNLPKILVQGTTIYCRMKADDFGAAQSTLKEEQTAPRVVIGNLPGPDGAAGRQIEYTFTRGLAFSTARM